ncbi:MAG: two-component regulator propeller domain-containing protein, partial [Cyclobacteriaceae bacterium]
MKFEQLTMEQGLSQTSVACILQDKRGFMWFGTEDGLNKYDGYQFKVYRHIPGDTLSLGGNVITSMIEDVNGYLWIGTGNGLSKYDPTTDSFRQYRNQKDNPTGLSIYTLVQDKAGDLWLGTSTGLYQFDPVKELFINQQLPSQASNQLNWLWSLALSETGELWIGANHGIYRFNPKTEDAIYYEIPSADKGSYMIRAIREDGYGNLLVGTAQGLYKFIIAEGKFKFIHLHSGPPVSYGAHGINHIYKNSSGNFWLSTPSGVIEYNSRTEEFEVVPYTPNDPQGLTSSYIGSVYEDKRGVLWVGSFRGGVYKHDPYQWRFTHYRNYPTDDNSLNDNAVRMIGEDQDQKIWIGAGLGLNRLDRRSGTFTHFRHDPGNPNSLSSDGIRSFAQDSNGNLWIGTWSEGLNKFDPKTGHVTRYQDLPNDSTGLNGVRALVTDDLGNLWIAANGLVKFELETGKFTRYVHQPENPQSISHNDLISLHIDKQGFIWIGTSSGGLNRFNANNETFTRYPHHPADPTSLSHNYVTSIFADSVGFLWVGTYGGGLNKLDIETGQIKHYNASNGLPNDVIYGILQDGQSQLWISSNKGICHFDPQKEIFKSYGIDDGLQSNEFNSGAFFKSANGEMFFGGINGLNVFHPDSIKDNTNIPDIAFTDFKIFNKPVAIGPDAPLEKSIGEVDQITVSYNQSVFSFEFVALNYTHPEKNQYAYKLEGFDQDWQYLGNRNFITFTNLDPGAYNLRVKGSNNDGVWNEEGAAIALVITPPWWRTWWAYLLYALVSLFALVLWRGNVIRREQLKAQFQLEHLKLEKIEELDRVKSTFFENISHEFRTPLTLILGTTERALSATDTDGKQKQGYGVIHRSAQKLLSLINQLLDLSKLEAGSMDLQAGKYDLIGFLKPITAAFSSLAQSREIHFLTNFPYDHLDLYFDKDKLEKVINNLLANAFKFTNEKGHVAITVSKHTADESRRTEFGSGFVKITIQDNGEGIDQDQVGKIFNRFYQVNDSSTREHEGTGIGLALSKELVELHQGEIQVESRLNKGSTFKVLLPIGHDHLKEFQIIEQDSKSFSTIVTIPELPNKSESQQTPEGRASILIVEDNEEMREYLEDILSSRYGVIQASNGKEALNMLNDLQPDLVISDVMMPKMDGITFCKRMKGNEQTSHIPIVMLTARADQGSREEGLEIGADAYLTKPFG